MSDNSYSDCGASDFGASDSGASDSTNMTHEAKPKERVKLIPKSVKQRDVRHLVKPGHEKLMISDLHQFQEPRVPTTIKPDNTNDSSDGKNLFGNRYKSPNVKNLFSKHNNRKHRKDLNAGYHSLDGDTTASDYSSADSEGDSEHNTDDTSHTTPQDVHEDKDTGEDEYGDMSVDGDDDGTQRTLARRLSNMNQNRAITHFWPLRPNGTEMTAREYIDWKNRGAKFECEPAAYRWYDGEAPVDREKHEEMQITPSEQADRLPGLDLPSSIMNFEDAGYDFENPFHSPFFSASDVDGFSSFMDA